MFKYFPPSNECTKPESSRLQNIGDDSGLRLPDCDTGCRRTETVPNCCLHRQKTQCDRQSCWWVAVCLLPRDDTLNTSFAEYLAFSLIFLFFYRCPIKSVVPPVPPLSEIWGARAPASSMAPAPMCILQDHYYDECDKIVFHNTTRDLQDQDHSVQDQEHSVQDQDRFFWSQTSLVLRLTVSDHITDCFPAVYL